jgi:hypothetical protein
VLTGITPIVINNRTDFTFRGAEYTSLRNPAKGEATRTIKRADATPDDVISAWNKYLDGLYRAQSQLNYYVEAARAMDTPDDVIRSQLKAANLGGAEIAAIMRGEFWPGLASKEVIKETKREMRNEDKNFLVNERPWGELNTLSNDRRGEKLSPVLFKEERDARLEERRLREAAETEQANSGLAGLAAPVVDFFQPQPEPVVAPQPEVAAPVAAPIVPQDSAPTQERDQGTLAALMGSNPIDAMKNLQIAQRLGVGN